MLQTTVSQRVAYLDTRIKGQTDAVDAVRQTVRTMRDDEMAETLIDRLCEMENELAYLHRTRDSVLEAAWKD